MNVIRIRFLPAAALLAFAGVVMAATPSKPDAREEIARRLDIKPEDVRPSQIDGLYVVQSGTEVGYVSEDGRFYLDGDVFDMTSKHNFTEDLRKQGRLVLLAGIKDSDAIVFSPAGPVRHTLTVFTDVDCQYCRRMHQEVAEFNRLGFRVRYLMYPRGGPDTESWRKAESVWCSSDRKEALTRAKRGEALKAANCTTPVAAQYELGRKLGIHGTPGIFTDTGEYLAGYMPPANMAEYLAEPAAAAKN